MNIERIYSEELLSKASLLLPVCFAFNAKDIVENKSNVVLKSGEDIGLFEYERPGVFSGHYFFKNAKGREAVKLAREMLCKVFTQYDADIIQGLTPVDNKGAHWVTKQLGFTSYGIVTHADTGLYELYILTANEFNSKRNQQT